MFSAKRSQAFASRHPLVGPVLWISSIQYFVIQIIVAAQWQTPYSLFDHTISDLGNTVCGIYGGRDVCSPLNPLMNASFILLGLTMLVGAVLIYQKFRKSIGSSTGFGFMALAGIGTVLVGLFPENTVGQLHFLGAALPFLIGNIGMIILGLALRAPGWLRLYSVASGLVALIALGFFVSHTYLNLGFGGMERIVAYPQTVWLIVFGFYLFRKH